MAITTYRVSKAAGWSPTDVITQLEEAFTLLGFHGGTVSGIVTGITGYSGQSNVGTSYTTFYDVRPKSGGTSIGVGDTCSFRVYRQNGSVGSVYVNRPGAGYADGDNLILDAGDFGGVVGIHNDMTVVVQVDETSYGSSSTFYDKDVTTGSSNPWGVLRMEVDNTKVYGDSYYGFQVSGTNLYFSSGSSFMPYNEETSRDKGHGYENSWRGGYKNELNYDSTSSLLRYQNNSVNTSVDMKVLHFASSNSFGLELNIFRSQLDPNFAVLSYKQPEKSSTSLSDNTYATFFLHKFSSNLWDYDDVFLGSMGFIDPDYRYNSNAYFNFYTAFGNATSTWQGRRALMGYSPGSGTGGEREAYNVWRANTYGQSTGTWNDTHPRIYYRNNQTDGNPSRGNYSQGNFDTNDPTADLPDRLNYNAIIKGIPIHTGFAPVPYYLPDEFVFIQFEHQSPDQNIQQFDTITVDNNEIYSVIDGAYNQSGKTRGILFCARTT